MNQNTYYVVDSLGVSHPETIDVQPWTLSRFFVEGGMTGMILISLMLIALLIAAWKAPRWVKEIGNFAFVLGLVAALLPLYRLLDVLKTVSIARGEGVTGVFDLISPGVLFGGKAILIPVIYGMCIYLVSLIVRMVQKPRL